MVHLNIEIRKAGAVQAIQTLADGLPPALVRGLIKATYHVENKIKTEIFETFPEGRTGALARSFRPVFLGRDGDVLSAAVKSDLVYARIQDEGGHITAKGKYLAVPINKRIPVGKWPRHFAPGELTFIERKGKPPMLVKITGLKKNFIGPQMGKAWTPMFILLRGVRLNAKRYLERAEKRAKPGVEEIIGASLSKLTDQANGGSSGGR